MTRSPTCWTFLSSHTFALICIALEPELRPCDLAKRFLIIRRAVQRNIGGLEEAVDLSRVRVVRRDRDGVYMELTLRHPVDTHCWVEDVLNPILSPKAPPD